MLQRIEHREEAISGSVRAEKYVETSKKHFGKLYRKFSYDISQLNLSGHYLEEAGSRFAKLPNILYKHLILLVAQSEVL